MQLQWNTYHFHDDMEYLPKCIIFGAKENLPKLKENPYKLYLHITIKLTQKSVIERYIENPEIFRD